MSTQNNIHGTLIESIAGMGSVREATDAFEIYACQTCNERRVWGIATTLKEDYVPPLHNPVLRCAGGCGGPRPHSFVAVRSLITTRHYGVGALGDAKVQSVRWRGVDGRGL